VTWKSCCVYLFECVCACACAFFTHTQGLICVLSVLAVLAAEGWKTQSNNGVHCPLYVSGECVRKNPLRFFALSHTHLRTHISFCKCTHKLSLSLSLTHTHTHTHTLMHVFFKIASSSPTEMAKWFCLWYLSKT